MITNAQHVDDQPAYLAEQEERDRAEQAVASAAARARREAAREAAEQAAAEQAAADRAALDAVPVDDDVDADPAVVELEERVAAGDPEVTAEQLADERIAAAGRVRFARLRKLAADRQARRDAEAAERAAAEAAEQHAREQLAPYAPAALVPLYDAAVAALVAYADAIDERNAHVRRLATLPAAERHRGAGVTVPHDVRSAQVDVDGHVYRVQQVDAHVERVLGAAGISASRIRLVRGTQYAVDDRDPALVAEGRAQLADG
jgi:hypothetical protein